MAKKTKKAPAGRVNTHKPNASTSMEAAPAPAGIVLPSPEDAVKVIERLGKINEEAGAALRRYEDLKKRTKDAKDEYDGIMVLIGVVIDKATHEAPMPLFDKGQREADLSEMERAVAEAGPAVQDAPETTIASTVDPEAIPSVESVPEPILADAEVF